MILVETIDPNDEGIIILRKVGNYLPVDTA